MAGVTAIQHPLGDIHTGAGDIDALIYVRDFVDRSAVHAHAHLHLQMGPQRFGDFQGALGRRLGVITKNQRHAVARREADQLPGGLGGPDLCGL